MMRARRTIVGGDDSGQVHFLRLEGVEETTVSVAPGTGVGGHGRVAEDVDHHPLRRRQGHVVDAEMPATVAYRLAGPERREHRQCLIGALSAYGRI